MVLEAVWFKDSKEVYNVYPVMNIVCDDDMKNLNEIEVKDWDKWHSCEENKFEADDFVIRIKKD